MRRSVEKLQLGLQPEHILEIQLPNAERQVSGGRIMRGVRTPEVLRLMPYNDEWPRQFEVEKTAILEKINPSGNLQVEHVGSTSINGLAAKPCIDIMIGTTSVQEAKQFVEAITSMGYLFLGEREDSIGFRKDSASGEAINYLYFVVVGSQYWNDVLNFRNKLRNSQALRDEYAEVKKSSLENNPGDRRGYVSDKSPFVRKVLMQAAGDNK